MTKTCDKNLSSSLINRILNSSRKQGKKGLQNNYRRMLSMLYLAFIAIARAQS